MTSIAETQSAETSAAQTAGGSSFYLAMRILPRPQREGMFEIYSFCRKVDDIADSDMPRVERSAGLANWRADIEALYRGETPAGLAGLARTVREFGLRKDDFLAVIDGMEMDAVESIRAPSWEKLDLYCDRVASAVGRLSVRVFGMEEEAGRALAHHLGRALQLTNILRDVDEDADIGRLYLPDEALQAAGIMTTDPKTALASPSLAAACAPVIARAEAHFDQAEKIMGAAPRRAVRAPRIMGAAYRGILDAVVARGFVPPRERVRLNKAKLLFTILRYAFI